MGDKKIFQNRWLIKGKLTTISPLHIRSGGTIPFQKDIECSSVMVDCNDRAYIPGTTLKGNLRAWLEANGFEDNILNEVFGSKTAGEKSVGGKAEFWDSMADTTKIPEKKLPYWDSQRLTGITASAARDRHTLATSDGKLFHYEFVPEGVTFGINISGQNLAEEEIIRLLMALEGFNAEFPVVLGSLTSNNWGRFEWKLEKISKIDSNGVRDWIKNGAEGAGYGILKEISKEECEKLKKAANEKLRARMKDAILMFDIILKFDSPFLVNDPGKAAADDDTEDYRPRRNHEGRVVLPARSVRGALRSQAERIIRTLGARACHVDDQSKSCESIEHKEKVESLCLACRVFGASGWQTALKMTDFTQTNKEKTLSQDFVAIDRFTGGAANKKKFNAEAVYMPELKGTVMIDLKRMEPAALGLIALLMRDLKEGDIAFGLGISKGYGSCIADISGEGLKGLAQSAVNDFRKNIMEKQANAPTRP